jgi:hypothetical protein
MANFGPRVGTRADGTTQTVGGMPSALVTFAAARVGAT